MANKLRHTTHEPSVPWPGHCLAPNLDISDPTTAIVALVTAPSIELHHGSYFISTDRSRVDVGAVHQFLTADGYWSKGRTYELVQTSITNSGLICAAYDNNNALVGFARMVTDLATFAWLCDVYVLEEHRGAGLGKAIVATIVEHPAVAHLKRQLLATRDAHSLYESFGFEPLDAPIKWMEKRAI